MSILNLFLGEYCSKYRPLSSGYQNENFPRCTRYFDALLKYAECELNLAYVAVKMADLESVKCFPNVEDLKPEQRLIVEHVVRKKDAFAALPQVLVKP